MSNTGPAIAHADDAALRAKLSRVVSRACPAWAMAHREDIVQAAMVRVLKVRTSAQSNQALPASYLWKVAYTATIDELRRLRAKREISLVSEGVSEPTDPQALGPERRTESAQLSTAIGEGLAALNDARRRAVTLYLLGHSIPEIARLLQWPPKRAENMVYRGLAKLREDLTARGWTP